MRSLVALLALAGCAPHLVAPLPADFPASAREHGDSLRKTVGAVVDGWPNLGRLAAVRRRARELGLDARTEWIDWFTPQRNVVIDLPGPSRELVYVIAHYDKIDGNPLVIPSLLLNGALDDLISWSYLSDGAVDNASGVAVALELAATIAAAHPRRSYRVLITGAEEAGLRGARAHTARIANDDWARMRLAMNIDSVGVSDRPNCVTKDVGDPELRRAALDAARRLGLPLGEGDEPALASADYVPFERTSFVRDFGRGLLFNVVGGLLPQRSWFTGAHGTATIDFSACDLLDAGDYFSGLLPIGRLHGPRDRISKVDPVRLWQQYAIAWEMLRTIDVGDVGDAATHE